METLWFVLVSLMLTVYVVLDGFDLGVGALYKPLASSAEDRALVRQSIGPVWDANEVWLLAAGGTLFFAFPAVYAASFSGFYLPLMIVLWLLMGRALGLELRGHIDDPLGREACDMIFFVSSALLAVIFGAALGNVVRGVPLDDAGDFFLPLWTDFRTGPNPGILDWYTITCGVVALIALTTHGAHYLAARTSGGLHERATAAARRGSALLPVATVLSLGATLVVRPGILGNFGRHPAGLGLPVVVVLSLVAMNRAVRRGQSWRAFGASAAYLVGMLGGAAFALFPVLLTDVSPNPHSLTIYNAHSGAYGLRVGLAWWSLAFVGALALFTYLYRSFRGKVSAAGEAH